MIEASVEPIRTQLLAEAHRRFGGERAEALRPALDALAVDLARVADTPLPADTEPAFFLADPAE